jgi:UDP-2,3-diacylglucosamine hydrolase
LPQVVAFGTFPAVEDTRLVVVADAHLGAAPARDEEALLRFLESVPRPGDTLLLAGDIFDYWFSYRRLIPRRNFRVAAALASLARRIPVAMVGGNHDRWGDTFWRDDAGLAFDPHELRLPAPPGEVLMIHGDGLHEERPGAAWMHRATSSPAVIAVYRFLHPDLGFWIADKMGHNLGYAEANPEAVQAAADRQRRWAVARLGREPGLRAVIMGHTHREALVEVAPNRWYLNPGAWLDGWRYATLDGGGATLHRFS